MKLKIEHETFRLRDYNAFLEKNRDTITAFSRRTSRPPSRPSATAGNSVGATSTSPPKRRARAVPEKADALPPGCIAVPAHIPGNVWKIHVAPGANVKDGDALLIIESMKMEITIVASRASRVREVRRAEGRAGQRGGDAGRAGDVVICHLSLVIGHFPSCPPPADSQRAHPNY